MFYAHVVPKYQFADGTYSGGHCGSVTLFGPRNSVECWQFKPRRLSYLGYPRMYAYVYTLVVIISVTAAIRTMRDYIDIPVVRKIRGLMSSLMSPLGGVSWDRGPLKLPFCHVTLRNTKLLVKRSFKTTLWWGRALLEDAPYLVFTRE